MAIRGPAHDSLTSKVPNRFVLTMVVARRTRDLNSGAAPLVKTEQKKPLLTALEETAAGKIVPETPSSTENSDG